MTTDELGINWTDAFIELVMENDRRCWRGHQRRGGDYRAGATGCDRVLLDQPSLAPRFIKKTSTHRPQRSYNMRVRRDTEPPERKKKLLDKPRPLGYNKRDTRR